MIFRVRCPEKYVKDRVKADLFGKIFIELHAVTVLVWM